MVKTKADGGVTSRAPEKVNERSSQARESRPNGLELALRDALTRVLSVRRSWTTATR
jgi:hypothetical protein